MEKQEESEVIKVGAWGPVKSGMETTLVMPPPRHKHELCEEAEK